MEVAHGDDGATQYVDENLNTLDIGHDAPSVLTSWWYEMRRQVQALLAVIDAGVNPAAVYRDVFGIDPAALACALDHVRENGFGECVDDDSVIEDAARAHLDFLRSRDATLTEGAEPPASAQTG